MARSSAYDFPWYGLRRAWVGDSDARTRAYLKEALSRAGYQATLCGEPGRILEPERTLGQSFAILPGLEAGRDLLLRLRAQDNTIPVILLSGEAPPHDGSLGPVAHLPAPFTSDSLQAAIAEALARVR